MKKKPTTKRKAKQKMTVMRVPQHMVSVVSGVADFTGVAADDVIKVIFALGIAWGASTKVSKDEKEKS